MIALENEIPLVSSVVRQAIFFRTRYPVKLPDAVIAATVPTHCLKSMTRNLADFESIAGLNLVDSFAIAL